MCHGVWMWVHRKYRICQIVRKLYSVESNSCAYLVSDDDGGMNLQNDVTYHLQFRKIK